MPHFALKDVPEQFGRGATQKDQAVFASLYEQYFPPLYRYTLSRIRNKEQAEDIVQKMFLKVYSIFLESGSITPFTEAYLFASVRNTLTDFFRKKKDITFDVLDQAWHNVADAKQITNQRVEQEDLQSGLQSALKELPPQEQEVLQLKFFGDLATAEIARILDTSEANVRQLQCRGLKRLRTYFATHQTL